MILAGCGNSTNPFLSDCAANNTADVQFQNKSASNQSYDVVWDGSRIVSNLAPGASSQTSSVSATSHTLEFKIAGTNTAACSTAYPSLSQCTSHVYSCTY
jgi:hypothetical protein